MHVAIHRTVVKVVFKNNWEERETNRKDIAEVKGEEKEKKKEKVTVSIQSW